MNQRLGRVTEVAYRSIGPTLTTDALRVHFRTPMDTMDSHDLPNGRWSLQCPALQFMALYGLQPTAIDGTRCSVESEGIVVPVMRAQDGWTLDQSALAGGEAALKSVEWFDGPHVVDDDGSAQKPSGGGSSDPGTGNRGGVEDPSEPSEETGVTVEKADGDAGIEVTVE
jgi:hypothetical protein